MEAKRLDGDLKGPSEAGWENTARHQQELGAVPLDAQPSRYIRTAWADKPYGLVDEVAVQAAHDGESLYIKLEWASPTLKLLEDEGEHPIPLEGPDAFHDAVAVMFAGDEGVSLMGDEGSPVTIWRWSAAAPDSVEDLVATGIGSVRPSGRANGLRAQAQDDGEKWQVVFSRALEPASSEGISFKLGSELMAGFAVWAGSNQERSGIKSASRKWVGLALEQW